MKFGKQLGSLALVAIGALGIASAAQAVEIPNIWTVGHNPSDVKLCSGGGTGCVDQYTWTHDITDNTGFPGGVFFDPASWTVTSANIGIFLYDDSIFDSDEYVSFSFDGNGAGNQEVGLGFYNFSLNALLSDGILHVLLDATSGDFYFAHSTLIVTAVSRVSEPGTLALLGLGLMGIGFAARRRAK